MLLGYSSSWFRVTTLVYPGSAFLFRLTHFWNPGFSLGETRVLPFLVAPGFRPNFGSGSFFVFGAFFVFSRFVVSRIFSRLFKPIFYSKRYKKRRTPNAILGCRTGGRVLQNLAIYYVFFATWLGYSHPRFALLVSSVRLAGAPRSGLSKKIPPTETFASGSGYSCCRFASRDFALRWFGVLTSEDCLRVAAAPGVLLFVVRLSGLLRSPKLFFSRVRGPSKTNQGSQVWKYQGSHKQTQGSQNVPR